MNWKWYFSLLFACLSLIIFILWFTPAAEHPWATVPVFSMLAVQTADTCLKRRHHKNKR
ncbi:hypothetical protein [Sporolactobacillus vineae]|uniref:hypothetical protein n=1 Tax=Sporolactobacillus vineae TaxID=444463 RepID=UPI0002F768BC|nr:hypothetical protein [Sporolactobacillus vineae]